MGAYNSLLPWQWTLVGIAIALVICLGILIWRFGCKKRFGIESTGSDAYQPGTEVPSPPVCVQLTKPGDHEIDYRNVEYSTGLSAPPPRIQPRHIGSNEYTCPVPSQKTGRICSLSLVSEGVLPASNHMLSKNHGFCSSSSAASSVYSTDISLVRTLTSSQPPTANTRHNSPFNSSMRGPTPPWTKS
ncbi:hypothetical protein J3Q64DRAFT_1840578 [Phycomyces blakesleeanus]|uniref:Uncharacterized protein n=2 Tax=Phycomyces blakesleeanus TaxID=4837 RepID=A0A167L878_PHYB8|nr:hypothetical protein PHYBLDRAFT_148990 [Phycomyces blakesleeanus NRRL 1555(-)]OAD69807.1 hypothetical protein PHYBLDRAFT_148990 [Phycomyces blakesleeanus NRRL 1555(-)]|eukprot:XP_018287847.1 hypothetical protein PHYBLDRAFT_148990 [Phycomyces blakesleeanus NRRL 1555(-)]